jgi:hypothetical protein
MDLSKTRQVIQDFYDRSIIEPTFNMVRSKLGVTHKELLNTLIVLEQRGYVARYNTGFHRIKLLKRD